MQSLLDRIKSKIRFDNGCWIWTGKPSSKGYGRISVNNKVRYAHVVSYECFIGPIPDGLDLDHLCRNTMCVRPTHLDPVTRKVNLLRGLTSTAINTAKSHCHIGHPFDEENTRYVTRKNGRTDRQCRACARIYDRKRRGKHGDGGKYD